MKIPKFYIYTKPDDLGKEFGYDVDPRSFVHLFIKDAYIHKKKTFRKMFFRQCLAAPSTEKV